MCCPFPPAAMRAGHAFLRPPHPPLVHLQVKCSLLILDLPRAEELTCQLFSTLLDAVK